MSKHDQKNQNRQAAPTIGEPAEEGTLQPSLPVTGQAQVAQAAASAQAESTTQKQLAALEQAHAALTSQLDALRGPEESAEAALTRLIAEAQKPQTVNAAVELAFDGGFDPEKVLEVVRTHVARLAADRLRVGMAPQLHLEVKPTVPGADIAPDTLPSYFFRYAEGPVTPDDRVSLTRYLGQLEEEAIRVRHLIGETGRQIAARSQAIRLKKEVAIAVPGGLTNLPPGTVISQRRDGADYYNRVFAQLSDPTSFEPFDDRAAAV